MRSFASDNNAKVHPKIFEALLKANEDYEISYGYDKYTKRTIELFKNIFGDDIEIYFVYNGTGANVLGLSAITQSYNAIICSNQAHIYSDECGAPEKFTGCKIIPVDTSDAKIDVKSIEKLLILKGVEHHSQPKVISITQSTELGTVYTIDELFEITQFAHKNQILVHMDGARISNAAVSLNKSLKEITKDIGVDVLSFGGTKNGMMFGEAVIFFNKELAKDFKYIRKHGMQLHSKMRYISAQFEALLADNLWFENAKHANNMAKYLESKLKEIEGIIITQKVEANAVFAIFPKNIIPKLQEKYFFYVWDEEKNEVRLMTSFDTTKEDIDGFIDLIKELI
ncbi:low specificity L-threonine aldolase [Caldicellulosiruptoraceae bacterium PP1]